MQITGLKSNEQIIDQLLATKRKPATRAAYRSDLAGLARFLETLPSRPWFEDFVSLPREDIQRITHDYKQSLIARGMAIATVNRRLAVVRALLTYASERGLAAADACALVQNQRVTAVMPAFRLSAMKLQCLLVLPDCLSVRGLRDAALLRLLCENALRPQDICEAKVSDFSRSKRQLSVPHGSGYRTVQVSDRCASVLGDYLQAAGHADCQDAPLLRNLDHRSQSQMAGLTTKGVRHILSGYGREVGIDVTPRLLRRTAVSLAAASMGQEQGVVQDLLEKWSNGEPSTVTDHPVSQGEITQRLSDLVSGANLARTDSVRLQQQSEDLRSRSAVATDRSGWLVKKSQYLQRRIQEQASRWARYEREKRDRMKPSPPS